MTDTTAATLFRHVLIRRDGVDAVFVSRWSWDGHTRSAERDPGRRFPQAAGATP